MNLTSKIYPHERFVRLGRFVIDVRSGEVQKDGQRVRIPDQPIRLLLALLEKPGEIVSREELRTKLWPDDTNVEFNHGIHAAINKLRQALGDSHEQPQFIETIPRRGYRLLVPPEAVTPAGVSAEGSVAGHFAPASNRAAELFSRRRLGLLLGATLILTVAALTVATLHFKDRK